MSEQTDTAADRFVARRGHAADSRDRRAEVYRLRAQGLTLRDVAERLGISERTAQRDLAAERAQAMTVFTDDQRRHVVGDALSRMDLLRAEAWSVYCALAPAAPAKLRALEGVRRAETTRLRARFDLGVLVQQPVRAGAADEGSSLPWTDEVRARISEALLNAKLSPLLDPIPED